MNEETGNEATGNEETGRLVLNLECTLAALPEEIFRMLTEPTELVKWWGPHGFSIPAAELNPHRRRPLPVPHDTTGRRPVPSLRRVSWRSIPHGVWCTPSTGRNPRRTTRETVVDLSLGSTGKGTRVVLSQGPFLTDERLDLRRNGWTESFEKLRPY